MLPILKAEEGVAAIVERSRVYALAVALLVFHQLVVGIVRARGSVLAYVRVERLRHFANIIAEAVLAVVFIIIVEIEAKLVSLGNGYLYTPLVLIVAPRTILGKEDVLLVLVALLVVVEDAYGVVLLRGLRVSRIEREWLAV